MSSLTIQKLRKLIGETNRIHPGDRVRKQAMVRQMVILVNSLLNDASGDKLIKVGEVLNELRKTHYYIFMEVIREIDNPIKAQDAIQKYRWHQIRRRFERG